MIGRVIGIVGEMGVAGNTSDGRSEPARARRLPWQFRRDAALRGEGSSPRGSGVDTGAAQGGPSEPGGDPVLLRAGRSGFSRCSKHRYCLYFSKGVVPRRGLSKPAISALMYKAFSPRPGASVYHHCAPADNRLTSPAPSGTSPFL